MGGTGAGHTGITGLNHITFAVSDLPRSIAFYREILGADLRAEWANGAYLSLGTLWLCLARGPVDARADYSHVALGCRASDFPEIASKIARNCLEWQDNSSEGNSIYFLDPDGHRLELHVGSLESRLSHYRANPASGVTIPAPDPRPDKG